MSCNGESYMCTLTEICKQALTLTHSLLSILHRSNAHWVEPLQNVSPRGGCGRLLERVWLFVLIMCCDVMIRSHTAAMPHTDLG